mmetsp:Transcript_15265/g.39253  ORF Transcript_15265/g.39253 Transcript_15265/m.39253 type:complete len:598 (+) Transcript_15265:41-1834(+)
MATTLACAVLSALVAIALGDGHCLTYVDNNINYINRDIIPAKSNVHSAAACCSLCVDTKGCTVYSYVASKSLCRFRNSTKGREAARGVTSGYTLSAPPTSPPSPPAPLAVPTHRQLEFMDLEFTQFMHFGIPTFWNPPEDYLYGNNPTYHDCHTTSIDHSNQTGSYYPCLHPDVFNPTDLNAEDWMEASASLGMTEIIITAHHEGGFALWPSNYTPYSVAASKWRNGKGDVLREFTDAANKWGIKISYYLNVQDDGYMVSVAKYSPEEFIRRQIGMIKEVLTEYGPVNRFWFDGTKSVPTGTNVTDLWVQVYDTIRTVSPNTMISSYRGDVCASKDGNTLYTNNGPAPNSTDPAGCQDPQEGGQYFHPTEMHGITIQEGPDGNTDSMPTYWFWHPWACAFNITGCPWIGHANASRIFDSYIVTVGRGAVLNMNIPPERTGRMNASVKAVMAEAGKAINDTFRNSVVQVDTVSGACTDGVVELTVPAGGQFDYIMSMEDLTHGQRFGNYSVDFQRVGSSKWETLVSPSNVTSALQDRPDGHDPRDSHIGHKRIDLPEVPTSGPVAVQIAKVRLNCLRAIAEPVYVRSFSLHKKTVPWE